MSLELLDKTRRLNQLLVDGDTDKINFNEFCRVLSRVLLVNVLLVSRKGKVLGVKKRKEIAVLHDLRDTAYGTYLDEQLRSRLLGVLSTKENVNLMTLGMATTDGDEQAMIAPISMAGRRLGTLFVYRRGEPFSIDDIILTEYGATVIGLAMQRAHSEEIAAERRKEQDMRDALRTLSRMELQAMTYVLDELEEEREGTMVTSRLAQRVGITRSVIVNALRKCESAGLIKTKSFGMKGTMIQIVNDLFTLDTLPVAETK